MRSVVLVLLSVLATGLSGCTSCEPLLDVRHCLDGCEPGPDAVEVVWMEEDAEAWPDVERLMDGLPAGEHDHAEWTEAQAQAFWDHYGVEGDEPELVVHRDEQQYRVRVLSCG